MGFWKRLFGRESRVLSDASVCDFCNGVVTGDKSKVALIKGNEAVAEFGTTLKLGVVGSPSFHDPEDGLPVWFACRRCLARYMEAKR
jgi:hypothetical protein